MGLSTFNAVCQVDTAAIHQNAVNSRTDGVMSGSAQAVVVAGLAAGSRSSFRRKFYVFIIADGPDFTPDL